MQISSMITKSGVSISNGKLATCNVCGKEGIYQTVSRHIEANHITGISHTCEICGSVSRSRNALSMHKKRNQHGTTDILHVKNGPLRQHKLETHALDL